jgi:hypothetical protein
MDAARHVAWYLCLVAWALWLPATCVAVRDALRLGRAAGRLSRPLLLVAVLVPVALLGLWFLVPFPYGSSTAINLTGNDVHVSGFYKGTAGRALLWALTPRGGLGAYATMVVSRLHVVPLALLALALLVARATLPAALASTRARTAWLLLLLLGPGVMAGLSNAKYYGAIPLAMATLLLALELRGRVARWIPLVLIPASLWLVALSRPESLFVSAALALFLLLTAVRERDRALGAVVLAVLLLLALPLVDAGAFFDHAVRHKRLLMGADTLGAASWTTAVARLVARVVVRTPLSLAGLLLASAGLLWLALVRARDSARARLPAADRLAGLYLLLYVLAVAVHQEGVGAWVFKYSMIGAVPVWHLATGALDTSSVRAHPRGFRAAIFSLAGVASCAWLVLCLLVRTTSVRQTALDQEVGHRMAAMVCADRGGAMLAFQTLDGPGESALLFTDRAPLDEYGVLREVERRCGVRPALDAKHIVGDPGVYDPLAFLCAPPPSGPDRRPATWAVVSLRSGLTVPQFLADSRNCGWTEAQTYGNVTVLRRAAPLAAP